MRVSVQKSATAADPVPVIAEMNARMEKPTCARVAVEVEGTCAMADESTLGYHDVSIYYYYQYCCWNCCCYLRHVVHLAYSDYDCCARRAPGEGTVNFPEPRYQDQGEPMTHENGGKKSCCAYVHAYVSLLAPELVIEPGPDSVTAIQPVAAEVVENTVYVGARMDH